MCEFLCRKVLLNVGGVRHEVQWKMLEQVITIFLSYHHLHHRPTVIAKITTLQKVDILGTFYQ